MNKEYEGISVCVCQDPKLRDVLGFVKGDNVEGKLVTVVHGNDLVNISFLNFQAMQKDAAKVTVETGATTIVPTPPHLLLLAIFFIFLASFFPYPIMH